MIPRYIKCVHREITVSWYITGTVMRVWTPCTECSQMHALVHYATTWSDELQLGVLLHPQGSQGFHWSQTRFHTIPPWTRSLSFSSSAFDAPISMSFSMYWYITIIWILCVLKGPSEVKLLEDTDQVHGKLHAQPPMEWVWGCIINKNWIVGSLVP